MIQLNEEEIERLRKLAAAKPHLTESMRKAAEEALREPVTVPESGIANWGHYYVCPACSVGLRFDPHDRFHHVCPQCGTVYTGEPYDSTWWGQLNHLNGYMAGSLSWLYLLTEDRRYAEGAARILHAYAVNYHNYEPHGHILYNGPGRVGAQTLDEGSFQLNMVSVFDRIRDAMPEEEQQLILREMFLPSAEFLREHRTNQIHNHEVIINSAIACIGILTDRKDLIDFAVYEPYGLIWQLEKGVQDNGMWFESTFNYQFFAGINFMSFEKFALHTPYSQIHHPNYRRMIHSALMALQDDQHLPALGDATLGFENSAVLVSEFLYRELKDPEALILLHKLYGTGQSRERWDLLSYGVETLPPCPAWEASAAVHPEIGKPGNTILRGAEGRWLLLKQDRYGGEHDHYDRLGISYRALGQAVATDAGTCKYGAVLHYDYFKNTATHNTVVINEDNQSPANAKLTRFDVRDGVTRVEAVCDWTAPFTMPDSYTVCQWNAETYANVRMVRRILWTDAYFAEIFEAEGADPAHSIDWVMHFREQGNGNAAPAESKTDQSTQNTLQPTESRMLSDRKPWSHLRETGRMNGSEAHVQRYVLNGVHTDVHEMPFGGEVILAAGPDNPSYTEVSYLIERTEGGHACFAHVIESYTDAPKIRQVSYDPGSMSFTLVKTDGSTEKLAW